MAKSLDHPVFDAIPAAVKHSPAQKAHFVSELRGQNEAQVDYQVSSKNV
jgi:hypothetical protein